MLIRISSILLLYISFTITSESTEYSKDNTLDKDLIAGMFKSKSKHDSELDEAKELDPSNSLIFNGSRNFDTKKDVPSGNVCIEEDICTSDLKGIEIDTKSALDCVGVTDDVYNQIENVLCTGDIGSINQVNRIVSEVRLKDIQDIDCFVPEDYNPNLELDLTPDTKRITDMKSLFKAINHIWPNICKKSINTQTSLSTLLQLRFPYFVPGGRFKEFYYWDSFWVLKGLLSVDMTISAENIVKNCIDLINSYGFIPNGTRKYYLGRTQPPFFVQMAKALLDYDKGRYYNFVKDECLPAAIKEYEWLARNRTVTFIKDGNVYSLSRFFEESSCPRIESYAHDLGVANNIRSFKRPINDNENKKVINNNNSSNGNSNSNSNSNNNNCNNSSSTSNSNSNSNNSNSNNSSNNIRSSKRSSNDRKDEKIVNNNSSCNNSNSNNINSDIFSSADIDDSYLDFSFLLEELNETESHISGDKNLNAREFAAKNNKSRNRHFNAKADSGIFTHLRSAAESGWDFSSRWMEDGKSMETLQTGSIIPVDLNAIMYYNETILSELCLMNKNIVLAEEFKSKANHRLEQMQELLWNKEMNIWNDYNISTHSLKTDRVYFSNFTPLFYGIHPPNGKIVDILCRYKEFLFFYPGGVPCSDRVTCTNNSNTSTNILNEDFMHKEDAKLFGKSHFYINKEDKLKKPNKINRNTDDCHRKENRSNKFAIDNKENTVQGEWNCLNNSNANHQWDFPNCSAPHQEMLATFLLKIDMPELALHVARSFYNNVESAFKKNGIFYEKYNSIEVGKTGKGGEYAPQIGFGWTNGVILEFIKVFGTDLLNEISPEESIKKIEDILNRILTNPRLQ